jgi:hypothetical protein
VEKEYIRIIKEYARLSAMTSKALEGLEEAIRDINDRNVVHVKALENNTEAVDAIRDYWGKIMKWLVLTVIVLAGAEKVLDYLTI